MNVLLSFIFSKLLNKQEKLIGEKTPSLQQKRMPVVALAC